MSKERSLDWWKTAIKNGMYFQNYYGNARMWRTYKAYYRHNFASTQLPVNLVFSVLRSLIPQVYFRDPIVTVTPTKPGLEHELHARLVQDIDNWLLRELNTKYQIKRMITDAFLCGISTGFVGYDSQFGFSPDLTVPGSEGAASLTQFDNKGNRIEYNARVNPGMPWFLRSRSEDVVYPWGCESAESAEWIAMRVFRPLEDIKKDRKYKNTNDLTGSFIQRRTTAEGTAREDMARTGMGTDHEWVELWQIHDAKTKEILALSMNHDKFLRREEDVSQVDGIPAETLVFNPDPDYVYGISDAKIIEPQLLELIEIRTQSMRHRRVDIIKLLYKKNAIDDAEVQKMLDPNVMAAIAVDSDAPSLKETVMTMPPGTSGILADMQHQAEAVRQDVREMVGFSRSATGEYQGKTHISAAETDVVQMANQIRVDERRDIVADMLTNIIRRFNQKIFTSWTSPMVRNIVGPDGAQWWLQFTGDQIKSEYTYKIDPNNGIPLNPMVKRQDAMQMAGAWAKMNMGMVKQGMPVPREIQRYFFSQFDGIDTDKVLAQQGGQQGPGMNPNQALPPGVAAQLMQKKGGK